MDNKNDSGFTLIETIVALGLSLITITMVMNIFANGMKYMRTMKDSEALNSNATNFINTADYWIAQGKDVKILFGGRAIEVTLPNDSTTSVDNSLLETNGVSATTTFTKMTRSVIISFLAQKGDETLSATTAVAERSF